MHEPKLNGNRFQSLQICNFERGLGMASLFAALQSGSSATAPRAYIR